MIKAVILAGGNGVRMYPLTLTRPKPLMKVVDKTIIEHNLDQLVGIVKEVLIVVGYRGDLIRLLIGDKYKNIKIKYVLQENQLGTGDAAKKAKPFLNSKFLLLNGDDIYFKEDIKKCLKKFPSILLGKVKDPSSFGVVECYNDFIRSFIEKPENPNQNSLVNTGLYFLDNSIFDFEIEKSLRGEYEFTDYIRALITRERLYFKITEKWIPISYPWNLLEANESMLKGIKKEIKGVIEKNVVVKNNVVIEQGAYIKSGTYIEGPVYIKSNTVIGPNTYIRGNTVIGENSKIGAGVEIKNSLIGDNTFIPHLNYVGDSVIGDYCNMGAGSIIANFRFDRKNIKVKVKEKLIDSQRGKLGAILGDRVNVGVNASIMPGTLIGSDAIIGPHTFVKNNISEGAKYFSEFGEKFI